MKTKFNLLDRVRVLHIEATGAVTKIRFDDIGNPIYTVTLDEQNATPDGIFYAREFELVAEDVTVTQVDLGDFLAGLEKSAIESGEFKMTKAEAHAKGLCMVCGEPALAKCYSDAGRREYQISGTCEKCFDAMFKEEE